jgi:hypothetical protein
MDRLRELYDPDAIVRTPPEALETGPFVGRDAIMQWMRQLRETVDSTDSFDVLSDDLAVADRVLVRVAWKGEGYGPPMNMEMELEYLLDHDEALEAVGLRE